MHNCHQRTYSFFAVLAVTASIKDLVTWSYSDRKHIATLYIYFVVYLTYLCEKIGMMISSPD